MTKFSYDGIIGKNKIKYGSSEVGQSQVETLNDSLRSNQKLVKICEIPTMAGLIMGWRTRMKTKELIFLFKWMALSRSRASKFTLCQDLKFLYTV